MARCRETGETVQENKARWLGYKVADQQGQAHIEIVDEQGKIYNVISIISEEWLRKSQSQNADRNEQNHVSRIIEHNLCEVRK
jgi:hypothetical protein